MVIDGSILNEDALPPLSYLGLLFIYSGGQTGVYNSAADIECQAYYITVFQSSILYFSQVCWSSVLYFSQGYYIFQSRIKYFSQSYQSSILQYISVKYSVFQSIILVKYTIFQSNKVYFNKVFSILVKHTSQQSSILLLISNNNNKSFIFPHTKNRVQYVLYEVLHYRIININGLKAV